MKIATILFVTLLTTGIALPDADNADYVVTVQSPQRPPTLVKQNTHDDAQDSLKVNTDNTHVSGSIDPLSVIYLIRDSPKIIAGIFKGIGSLFGHSKNKKHDQQIQGSQKKQAQKYEQSKEVQEAQNLFNGNYYELYGYCIKQEQATNINPDWHDRATTRRKALDGVLNDQYEVFSNPEMLYLWPPTTPKSYSLSKQTLANLNSYDLDVTVVQKLTGNRYQHLLQRELVHIIEKATTASFTHATYQEIVLTCSVSACAYNQIGEALNATRIADFCWAFLDYGSAAIEGVGLGLASALLHIAAHPIATTLYAVAGPYMLAYQLTTTLYSVLDIGITHTYDPESAHQKWNEFVQPVTNIYAALTDKERVTREKIKMGTALATSFYAQTKLIGGLQKLCRSISQEVTTWLSSRITSKIESPTVEITTLSKKIAITQNGAEKISNLVGADHEKELFNFSLIAAKHMEEKSRMIPVHILDEIIKNPLHVVSDPRGLSKALMYYSQIWVNQKLYNVEVLYDKSTNIIWHFLYKQDKLGPLPRIK